MSCASSGFGVSSGVARAALPSLPPVSLCHHAQTRKSMSQTHAATSMTFIQTGQWWTALSMAKLLPQMDDGCMQGREV